MIFRDGPWPDPTRAYFWPAVNKKLTHLWPRYFLTRPEEILFDPKQKKLENLWFSGEIFQTLIQTKDGWPDLRNKKLIRPKSEIFFDPDPSLLMTINLSSIPFIVSIYTLTIFTFIIMYFLSCQAILTATDKMYGLNFQSKNEGFGPPLFKFSKINQTPL